jgi:hypothetical protein
MGLFVIFFTAFSTKYERVIILNSQFSMDAADKFLPLSEKNYD